MKRLSTRRGLIALIALIVVFTAVAWFVFPLTPGDQTRPPEAEGKAYVDLDGIDPADTVVKFDDKWWYVNQTSGELELIAEDPP